MRRMGSAGGAVKFAVLLALPVLVLALLYPTLSVAWFKLQEPTFAIPLGVNQDVQVREDGYGSGYFGARRSGGRKHRGVDLTAPVGTPVLAAKSGTALIGRKKNGMGRYVEVLHPDGWKTLYGHLSQIAIEDHQRIRQGEAVGAVGKSGNASYRTMRAHLHFELWSNEGVPVDPLEHLPVREKAYGA